MSWWKLLLKEHNENVGQTLKNIGKLKISCLGERVQGNWVNNESKDEEDHC